MDLDLDAQDLEFRQDVRAFLAANLPGDLRRKMINRDHLIKDDIVRWQRILNARGWATPNWPVEYGGTGWTPAQRYIFQEEMALARAPETLSFNVNMIGHVLCHFGTAEQKSRFLAPTANLDIWWCQGFSEPGAGSDLASLKSTATREGDEWVLDGQKIWTTQAQYADWMFGLFRTDNSGKKQQGISFLIFPMTTPGITVRPIRTLDGEADLNEVFFDSVRIPAANIVGEVGGGWDVAKNLLGSERSGIARVGLSKERLLQLRKLERQLTANGVLTLFEQQRLAAKLAEVEVDLRALELTQLRVVSADAHGGGAASAASVLKVRGTEIQQRMSELILELAGPAGLARPSSDRRSADPELDDDWIGSAAPFYLNMRKPSIFGGANEIQKNIVAKTMLGL